jgi:SAM-dependent methyltransferase
MKRFILLRLRLLIKDLLFPGIDFCLRKRLNLVKRYLKKGPIKTLDAGCGNGAFCFLCYRLGNEILGIDIKSENIKNCIEYRNYKGIPESKVRFAVFDIYNLFNINEKFDQIVCFETLEHLIRDREALDILTGLLKPYGFIHLGVPNFNCPHFYGERISSLEDGSHVRKGYTLQRLEEMMEEFNLKVIYKDYYGGLLTRKFTVVSRKLQDNFIFKNFPQFIKECILIWLFLIFYPFTYLDKFLKAEPMSIYICAQKC